MLWLRLFSSTIAPQTRRMSSSFEATVSRFSISSVRVRTARGVRATRPPFRVNTARCGSRRKPSNAYCSPSEALPGTFQQSTRSLRILSRQTSFQFRYSPQSHAAEPDRELRDGPAGGNQGN